MYQYKQCGLDNVWLKNGFQIVKTPYGEAVSFEDADELDQVIARALIKKTGTLSGKEFRFLRQQMGMSQNDIASLMRLDTQTIARWEKEQVKLPFSNDALLRFVYAAYVETDTKIYPMIETMKIIDQCKNGRILLSFDEQSTDWQGEFIDSKEYAN